MSSESFMGSVTANQVIDPKYASNQSPTDPQKTIGRHPCTYVLIAIIVVLLIFPIVTIPILFSLYGRKSTDSTSTSSMVKCYLVVNDLISALKHRKSNNHWHAQIIARRVLHCQRYHQLLSQPVSRYPCLQPDRYKKAVEHQFIEVSAQYQPIYALNSCLELLSSTTNI